LAEINVKYPQKMALHFELLPKAPLAKSITCASKRPQRRVLLFKLGQTPDQSQAQSQPSNGAKPSLKLVHVVGTKYIDYFTDGTKS
jgi:hypothetical protein